MEKHLLPAMIVFSGLMCLAGGCLSGVAIGSLYEQKKAVEAGVGRWVVDEKTGDRRFEYGPAK